MKTLTQLRIRAGRAKPAPPHSARAARQAAAVEALTAKIGEGRGLWAFGYPRSQRLKMWEQAVGNAEQELQNIPLESLLRIALAHALGSRRSRKSAGTAERPDWLGELLSELSPAERELSRSSAASAAVGKRLAAESRLPEEVKAFYAGYGITQLNPDNPVDQATRTDASVSLEAACRITEIMGNQELTKIDQNYLDLVETASGVRRGEIALSDYSDFQQQRIAAAFESFQRIHPAALRDAVTSGGRHAMMTPQRKLSVVRIIAGGGYLGHEGNPIDDAQRRAILDTFVDGHRMVSDTADALFQAGYGSHA